MHSKRISHPKRKTWWLIWRFRKDSMLVLHRAATVEACKQVKRRFYPGLRTRIVEAK